MNFLRLRQRFEDIGCQGCEWSSCRRYSKRVRSFPELYAVLRAGRTVADRLMYIGCHLRPIIRFANMSMHAALSEVAGQFRVVSEVEHTRSERVG